jgi:hypothetical protein
MKSQIINISFDSNKSNNIVKEIEKDSLILNLNNLSIEELLNIDDIIEKMSNYKNKSSFSQ